MRLLKFCIFLFIFFIASCSSKKNILYIQDIDGETHYDYSYDDYKISVDDILKIDVLTENPETSIIFNQDMSVSNNSVNKDALLYNGYQVSIEGTINFPQIGKINVKGKTLTELRSFLYDYIVDNQILLDPVIDIKVINSHFTILGEVNNPGKYDYLKNNMNIFEAIGMAGDLTITGTRNNVKILRNDNGNKKVITVDLTKSNFLTDSFQIFSGDIIIVNPNSNRVKNAGIIGNSGTLLSLLSFILSSIIVINN